MTIQRTVIVGAGAVGAGTAAELALRGADHLLIGRGEQIRHIARHGLRYIRPDGAHTVELNTAEGIASAELRPGDLLVMATKTQHVEEASAELAWSPVGSGGIGADLPILTLQNGMAAEGILLRRFPEVYAGSILIPASYTEIGTVVSGAAPKLASFVVGRATHGVDARCEQIADLLRGIGWLVQVDENVTRWKALKLLHSVKNALEVIEAEEDQKKQWGRQLTAEAAAVFSAAGIPVARHEERTVDMSQFDIDPRSGYQDGQQSTWQSFARGASSHEADWLNGEIVRLGRAHGMATPANEALQRVMGRAGRSGATAGSVPAGELLTLS